MEVFVSVILVGGPTRGTRFRPLGFNTPKPLFPIGGAPMIYHHIKSFSNDFGRRASKVFLLGSYEPNLFDDFLKKTSKELGIPIEYVFERKPKGTAGGIFEFKKIIKFTNPTHIFVMSSDICCSFPFGEIFDFHTRQKRDPGLELPPIGTMMSTRIAQELASNYGCCVVNPQTNIMIHYSEKPSKSFNNTINCGLYLFDIGFLDRDYKEASRAIGVLEDLHSESLHKKTLSMEYDILPNLALNNEMSIFEYKEFWKDIKTTDSAFVCNNMYFEYFSRSNFQFFCKKENCLGNVIIDPSATIDPTSCIGPNVYIGANTVVNAGVRIKNSIILNDCIIKENACIIHTIMDSKCVIGQWARVEGRTPTGESERNMTVLGNGTSLKHEMVVLNCVVMPYKKLESNQFERILL